MKRLVYGLIGFIAMCFCLMLAACTPTFRVELGSPQLDPQQVEWQKRVTEEINDHELRIQDLEKEIRNAK